MRYIHIVQERTISGPHKGEWTQEFYSSAKTAIAHWNKRIHAIRKTLDYKNIEIYTENGQHLYESLAIIPAKEIDGRIELMVLNHEIN